MGFNNEKPNVKNEEKNSPVVLGEIKTTNFELLRLMKNGGDLDSRGIGKKDSSLFTIRAIRTGWEKKIPSGQLMFGVTLQIVSNGIDNFTARKDTIVHKVTKTKTVTKFKKPEIKVDETQTKIEEAEEY